MSLRKAVILVAGVGLLIFIWYLLERQTWDISPLGLMLGSGVVAGVVTQVVIWWKEHSREKEKTARERQFVALQLAVTLERYAIECAMRITHISDVLNELYEQGGPLRAFPILPPLELPSAAEWRWIAPDLASEVMSLTPKISFGNGSIDFLHNIAGEVESAEESQRQLRLVGHTAWTLGRRLRATHNIPPQTYVLGKWDFLKDLHDNAPES
jgi:hypothetical protein